MFNKTKCVFCRAAVYEPKISAGDVGVCAECLEKLPETGSLMSFDADEPLDYALSPFYYKDPVRSSIIEYKFSGSKGYAEVYAALLSRAFERIEYMLRGFDILVPVPLSRRRMRERGYNQAALIAKPFAESLGIDYSETALTRSRNTKAQSKLQNYDRVINVKDAFSASDEVNGKSVIIFDDIFTTGRTLTECAKAVKAAGAERAVGITLAISYRGRLDHEIHIF